MRIKLRSAVKDPKKFPELAKSHTPKKLGNGPRAHLLSLKLGRC